MVTASKGKSFQRNLLLSIGGVFLLFAVCFSVYQYRREKEYKIDILHSRLQMYNYEMAQTLGEDSLTSPPSFTTMWRAIAWRAFACRSSTGTDGWCSTVTTPI